MTLTDLVNGKVPLECGTAGIFTSIHDMKKRLRKRANAIRESTFANASPFAE